MKIVFAMKRHMYDSYRDFCGLVALGRFDTCFIDEMDLTSDTFYIVTPIDGEIQGHVNHFRTDSRSKRAIVAWWNLERPDAEGSRPFKESLDDSLGYVDVAWTGDRHYAAMDPRMQHVVLGGDEGLCPNPGRRDVAHDYTHQSYVWGRRDKIHGPLRALGLREGPNAWFDARDAVLKSSRVMVNVHQTDALIGEPIRFAMTAAYRLAMISETMVDPFPLVPGHDYIEVPFGGVIDAVRKSTSMSPDELEWLGNNLFERLCREWPFRRGVEEGVAVTLQRLGRDS